jgi:hypothetical protein
MSQRNGLYPSREIVGSSKNVLVEFLITRSNFSYDIQTPLLKKPGDIHGLKRDCCPFLLSSTYLTSLTVLSVSMSIFKQGGPVIDGFQNLMGGSVPCKVSSGGAIMEFLQHLVSVLSLETSQ